MEKLLEQAQALVKSLMEKIKQSDEHIANLAKQQICQDEKQFELDNVQEDLLQREVKIKPIENISETQRNADESKAQAELEWSKIRGEWDKLDDEKAKFVEECRITREDIKDKKDLYDRGAEENKKTKEQLDERAKKIKDVTAGV